MKKEELFKKANGEMKEKYKKLSDLIKLGNKKFHLKYWTGSGRHISLVDTDYYNMISLLNALNIKYELGNDAPRGGAAGDYIKIKSRKSNKEYKNILNGIYSN